MVSLHLVNFQVSPVIGEVHKAVMLQMCLADTATGADTNDAASRPAVNMTDMDLRMGTYYQRRSGVNDGT